MKKKIYLLAIIFIICFVCACTTKQYTVTFDTDGGSAITAQTVNEGDSVSRPANPEKAGYRFINWYLNDQVYDFSSAVTGDITIKAKWIKQVKITFNSNGGSAISEQVIDKGLTAQKPQNPTKGEYVFDGWYLGENQFDFSTSVEEDITLIAKWKTASFTVTYNYADGSTETKEQLGGTLFENKTPATALVFDGWYTADGVLYNSESIVNAPIEVYENSYTQGLTFKKGAVVGYEGESTKVVIPAYYGGFKVESIKKDAFEGAEITEVTFGVNLIIVEEYAFRSCHSLKAVNFGNSVQILGEGAFFDCPAIEKLDLPNSIKEIGYGAFAQKLYLYDIGEGRQAVMPDECALEEISLPFIGASAYYTDTSYLSYLFGCSNYALNAFHADGIAITMGDEDVTVHLYTAVPTSLKKVTVRNLEVIPDNAFYGCVYLESIVFDSEAVTIIGESAFESCINANIEGIESAEIIGDRAFFGSSLKQASFPNLLTIGELSFANTLIEEFVASEFLMEIGMGAFSNTSISEIVIPESVQVIDDMAFYNCSNLTKIYFESETPCDLGEALFTILEDDDQLYYSDVVIYVPNGDGENKPYEEYRKHLYMRDYASGIFPISFENQTGYIVDGDLLLGYVSEEDEDYDHVVVPVGVKKIADFAFYNLAGLKSVSMPEGFEVIGKYVFYNCTSIKNLYIPSTLKEIDDYAFAGFFVGNYISRIYLPEGFKRIGEGAFLSSFNLKIVDIPSTIEYIGYLAFGMSNSLERFYIRATTPPAVGVYENGIEEPDYSIFSVINSAKTIIYVPSGKASTGENAGKSYADIYKNSLGFKDFASYVKATPNGAEVGHYGDGELFIDLDGSDTAVIYTVKKLETPDEETSSRYGYEKEYGSYVITGNILKMNFESYGEITAIYSNRTIHIGSLNGKAYTLKEPKKYYDEYNWTTFVMYERAEGEGKGLFDMYGYFLTPFDWSIDGNTFKITIDGNNVAPENSAYHGAVQYSGSYDKATDTLSVAFMMNDYDQIMEFSASSILTVYATAKEEKFYGTYKAFAENNPEYAMYTLVSYGNGKVDIYIGEAPYLGFDYTIEGNVVSIDYYGMIIELTIDANGNMSGSFLGMDSNFIYEDQLLPSTEMPY